MDTNKELNNAAPENEQDSQAKDFLGKHLVVIFTILSILMVMKEKLGLEVMLEYMEKYLTVIGETNPKIKQAVRQALSLISVEKMYHDLSKT